MMYKNRFANTTTHLIKIRKFKSFFQSLSHEVFVKNYFQFIIQVVRCNKSVPTYCAKYQKRKADEPMETGPRFTRVCVPQTHWTMFAILTSYTELDVDKVVLQALDVKENQWIDRCPWAGWLGLDELVNL